MRPRARSVRARRRLGHGNSRQEVLGEGRRRVVVASRVEADAVDEAALGHREDLEFAVVVERREALAAARAEVLHDARRLDDEVERLGELAVRIR